MTSTSLRRARRLWRGNLAAILRGNVMNSVLGLIAGLILAKVLEPEGRGLLAIALAWPGIALAFLGLGLRNVAAFFAARHPDRHGEVLRACLQLALVCTTVIYVVGFAGSWLFARDNPDLFKALLIGFLATPFALLTGIRRGMLNTINLKLWSRVRLIQPAVYAGTVVLVALSGQLTVVAGAVAYLVSLVVAAGCGWWIARTPVARHPGRSFRALRKEMRVYGFKSSLALSAQVTNVRLDVALLGIFLPASQVGLYAVASSLTQYIVPLSTAAAPWVFPRIARRAPTARSWQEAQRAVRLTIVLAGGMAVLMGVLAPLILGRLLGPEWLGALVPLWILLVGAVMQSVRFTQVSIASAYNRPELSAYAEVLAAAVTVVALWPMVEMFGVAGAAAVSVMAYSTSALLLRRGIIRAVQADAGERGNGDAMVPAEHPVSLGVTFVERQPAPGRHFSIERVFDAVVAGVPSDVTTRRVRVPRAGISLVAVMRNMQAARLIRSDVAHVTGDVHYVLPALPRSSVRILTIHDLASLHRTKGLRRRIIRWFWYTRPLAHADAVTTVSEETRRQMIAEFAGVADKVTVVENPLDPGFASIERRSSSPSTRTGPAVVLAIGTAANKNLPTTAEAVRRVGASLRIVGRLDDELTRTLQQLGVPYSAVHSLSDAELLQEYLSADVLAFASLNEGFGLPILEAQAVGLPVVTSNFPPMSEICAGAAVLVDPGQPTEIADALTAVLSDPALRHKLVTEGLANADKHSASHVAGEYVMLYRRAMLRRQGGGAVGRVG